MATQRMTPLREKILTILTQDHMLSAMQILAKLESFDKKVNKTSVYRALEFLEKAEKICQHQFSFKEAVFELRTHHHDHVICNSCGKIEEVECLYHPPKEIQGYHIDHHHLTLFGVCEVCREKTSSSSSQS